MWAALPEEHGKFYKVLLVNDQGQWEQPEPHSLGIVWDPNHLMDRRINRTEEEPDTRVVTVKIYITAYFESEEYDDEKEDYVKKVDTYTCSLFT